MKRCPTCQRETLYEGWDEHDVVIGPHHISAWIPADKCDACPEAFYKAADLERFDWHAARLLGMRGYATGEGFRFMRKAIGLHRSELVDLFGLPKETIESWERNPEAPVDKNVFALLSLLVYDKIQNEERTTEQLLRVRSPTTSTEPVRMNLGHEGDMVRGRPPEMVFLPWTNNQRLPVPVVVLPSFKWVFRETFWFQLQDEGFQLVPTTQVAVSGMGQFPTEPGEWVNVRAEILGPDNPEGRERWEVTLTATYFEGAFQDPKKSFTIKTRVLTGASDADTALLGPSVAIAEAVKRAARKASWLENDPDRRSPIFVSLFASLLENTAQ